MKKLLSIILLALPVTVMAGNFTGNEIRISSEAWKADKDGKFSTIATRDDIRVKPFYDSGTIPLV
ncbi:MAG: hypothetical protein H0A75_06805 [Candidatus Methanofishera endochildressiae]|uniref:Uncharacterized protein n=1 Tax=Candidatus Methanofishera endochildressiae TaxID=2738884 RepID=A0A7Z0SD69_9GAMM|nr:hypothetical protein [Candidatus Methanofishera endochildressiae]